MKEKKRKDIIGLIFSWTGSVPCPPCRFSCTNRSSCTKEWVTSKQKEAKAMLPQWVGTLKSGPIQLLTKLPKSSEQHWGCIRALGSLHAKLDIMERKQLPSAKHSSMRQLNESTNSHKHCYNAVENQWWRSKHLTIPKPENFCKKKFCKIFFLISQESLPVSFNQAQ